MLVWLGSEEGERNRGMFLLEKLESIISHEELGLIPFAFGEESWTNPAIQALLTSSDTLPCYHVTREIYYPIEMSTNPLQSHSIATQRIF